MARQIIKPDPALDLYVGWSSVTEGPVYFGTRAEVLPLFTNELLEWATRTDIIDSDPRGSARHRCELTAAAALQRADEYGSSSVELGMTWGARIPFRMDSLLDRDGLLHLIELLINDPAGEHADPARYDMTGWAVPRL